MFLRENFCILPCTWSQQRSTPMQSCCCSTQACGPCILHEKTKTNMCAHCILMGCQKMASTSSSDQRLEAVGTTTSSRPPDRPRPRHRETLSRALKKLETAKAFAAFFQLHSYSNCIYMCRDRFCLCSKRARDVEVVDSRRRRICRPRARLGGADG